MISQRSRKHLPIFHRKPVLPAKAAHMVQSNALTLYMSPQDAQETSRLLDTLGDRISDEAEPHVLPCTTSNDTSDLAGTPCRIRRCSRASVWKAVREGLSRPSPA